jgi:alpha-L-fucosidase
LGIYISPWDRNHAEYGKAGYVEAYHEQWRETLEYSDDIWETWFDGANGGTGYYGGAREHRKIEKGYYQFPSLFKLIKAKHPGAILFGYVEDVKEDVVRWGGTEDGSGSETNWCRYNDVTSTNWKEARTGVKDGKYWMPVEGNTTILYPKKWYYNESSKPRTLRNFVDLYYSTIGQNANFILGLSIGPDGLIPKRDVESMLAQKKQIDMELSENLAADIRIRADNTRGNSAAYGPANIVDDSNQTFWATDDGIGKASIILDFGKETSFNRLLLQEYIRLGQRIHKFALAVETDAGWREVAAGTTIGYKRILRFESVLTSRARITFETDAPALAISNIEIYNAPPLLTEPEITCSIDGKITMKSDEDLEIFYSIGSSAEPLKYSKYRNPLELPGGGLVQAYTVHVASGHRSDIASREFGIAKTNWTLQTIDGEMYDLPSARNAIDGNPDTYWTITPTIKSMPAQIAIDLGEVVDLSGFGYIPPALGADGAIFEYAFYVSMDGKNWGEPVSSGEFANIENNPIAQIIKLDKPLRAQYVKLVAHSMVKESMMATVAEIDIFAATDFGPAKIQ